MMLSTNYTVLIEYCVIGLCEQLAGLTRGWDIKLCIVNVSIR